MVLLSNVALPNFNRARAKIVLLVLAILKLLNRAVERVILDIMLAAKAHLIVLLAAVVDLVMIKQVPVRGVPVVFMPLILNRQNVKPVVTGSSNRCKNKRFATVSHVIPDPQRLTMFKFYSPRSSASGSRQANILSISLGCSLGR